MFMQKILDGVSKQLFDTPSFYYAKALKATRWLH